MKGKVWKTVARAAILCGSETAALRKRQQAEPQVAEIKMLSSSSAVSRTDGVGNENIRGTLVTGTVDALEIKPEKSD